MTESPPSPSPYHPRHPPIRAIFLDFHGTAVPYCSSSTTWLSHALSTYSLPPFPPLLTALFNGAWREEALTFVYEWADLASHHIPFPAFCKLYTDARTADAHSRVANPGVVELLELLSTRAYVGYPDAAQRRERVELVLVNGGRRNVFAGLKEGEDTSGIQRFFPTDDSCVTVGDLERRGKVPRRKPSPDVYLLALETVNERRRKKGLAGDIAVGECLVLEDSFNGVRSAMEAGMEVVWVPEGEVRELMEVITEGGDAVERLIGGREVTPFVREVMERKVKAGLEAMRAAKEYRRSLVGFDPRTKGIWVEDE
ncbi:HAD-like protein [Ascobolus immersus RN42]|uniref:HAD-like protein n=1 Tax=Ascobolus immersus RN42 TaxID=1160509 RepID=A0A3N4IF12_ASCIM|nr:HAD-like protein [Ascobolus immersus RN42]